MGKSLPTSQLYQISIRDFDCINPTVHIPTEIMKLFALSTIAAVALSQDADVDEAKAANYDLARSGEFEKYSFEVVPEGFEGEFAGFNTTAVIEENKDDEIFREFEVLYSYVDSGLGRTEYTEEQKSMIRKFKLLKNMIVYLQRIPLFGKFCFYGCYCFAEGPFRLLENAGNGQPVDPADNACRRHNRCHFCAKQDFDSKCDMTSTYKFEALEDEVTGERFINCLNPEGSCKRNICECDKQLAYGLRDAELNWNILHHARWGGFAKDNCLAYRNGRSATDRSIREEKKMACCGQNPHRFPYAVNDGLGNVKQCCGDKTYNPFTFTCCDNQVMEIGTC